MGNSIQIVSFYAFAPIVEDRLVTLRTQLKEIAHERDLRGLIILATEGLNGTVSGSKQGLNILLDALVAAFHVEDLCLKINSASGHAFRRFSVKIRPEIVTSRVDGLGKDSRSALQYLEPDEWEERLRSSDDFILLDTRNNYETKLGSFRDATKLDLVNFQHFADAVAQAQIPKEKPLLVFCTGGIRCEKAVPQLEALGYKNIFQLKGGILRYLEQYPNSNFEGECFVFDNRVAVDQQLAPSQKYSLCPHCGDPAERPITCRRCGKSARLCDPCLEKSVRDACSSNCANQLARQLAREQARQRHEITA